MAAGDEPVQFNRKSADLIGRVIKEFRGRGRGEQPPPRRRRGDMGAGNSTSNLVSFALVITAAGANGASTGTMVVLDEDMVARDINGDVLITDPTNPNYNQALVNGVAAEFKSAQVYAPCPVGARIWISSRDTIRPGSVFGDAPVWGVCVDVVDYLFTLPGFAQKTSLAVPNGGTDAGDIKWAGGVC